MTLWSRSLTNFFIAYALESLHAPLTGRERLKVVFLFNAVPLPTIIAVKGRGNYVFPWLNLTLQFMPFKLILLLSACHKALQETKGGTYPASRFLGMRNAQHLSACLIWGIVFGHNK